MVTAVMKLQNNLFLGRKAMKNLDSILKSRGITLLTKEMNRCEGQVIIDVRVRS